MPLHLNLNRKLTIRRITVPNCISLQFFFVAILSVQGWKLKPGHVLFDGNFCVLLVKNLHLFYIPIQRANLCGMSSRLTKKELISRPEHAQS